MLHKLFRTQKQIGTWNPYLQPVRPASRIRVWPSSIMLSILFALLLIRLAQLTVVEGAYYRSLADENRLYHVRVTPERGILFDRQGRPIVQNIPQYKRQVPGTSVAQGMFEEISKQEAVESSKQSKLQVFFDVSRNYLCGRACSLLVGYVGEVTADQIKAEPHMYRLGDNRGQSGLELTLESRLRGTHGEDVVEIDARGQIVRDIAQKDRKPGEDIRLSIDMHLQQFAYEQIASRSGSIIVSDPSTGEVYVMVSSPSYDPNAIAQSLQEPGQPFFYRATQAVYPPGSVFKMVTAIAGLEEGVISSNTEFQDTGELRIDEYRFGNWLYDSYGRTDGAVDVVRALQRSNDIFFYKLSEGLGAQRLSDWAHMYGYGEPTYVAGLSQAEGLVPNPSWKEQFKGERWYLGNTFHMSIGQGDMLATPLQVQNMTNAIANEGVLCPPNIVQHDVAYPGCQQLAVSSQVNQVIVDGMVAACKPGGTGSPFFTAPYPVACKTGTAQQGGPDALPHAWFTMFAPVQNPEVSITVMLEAAGQGSTEAGPVAKAVYEKYMELYAQ